MAICLVTGGAGFIGSHLVSALVRRGDTVRVFDNLSTGRQANLSGVRGQAEFIEGDICDLEAVRSATRGAEIVFHQAAYTSIPGSMADPIQAHRVCATGTMQVLTAALECNVRRVVYASSSACAESDRTARRDFDTPSPRSPYSAAKLAGEHYCRMFLEAYGLETVCLRYFHVYGPRQEPGGPYGGVIPLFIEAMLAGNAPVIFGDGSQARDFTYVDDAVHATLLAATAPTAAGRVFNIASGQSTTLLELVAHINRMLSAALTPQFAPARIFDVRHCQADISRAHAELGFLASSRLEDGLSRCLEDYRGRQAAARPAPAAARARRSLVLS
jgi:UDP-glucose 4-epimerase